MPENALTPPSAHLRRPGRPRVDADHPSDVADRLIDAATALAADQSFDACGLREIAARAGVSSGMISYYFGDRQGLYEAMFQRAIDRVTAEVHRLLDEEAGPLGNRLDALVALHVSAIASDPWLPRLIVREMMAAPEATLRRALTDRVGTGAMPMMIDWIEGQQNRGMLRPDLDARLLTVSLISLSVFPFLMLPMVGEDLGLAVDEDFPARLIEHNQRLLGRGLAPAAAHIQEPAIEKGS